jgi:GTP diphosphokinase / guanosine-3',5'-bis(diphosphate) 3'-diphosphatase
MTDGTRLLGAIRFAAEKHRTQKRKDVDASPYVNHTIEVAETIARIGLVTDDDVLLAAVLHDTLEDTETTRAELAARFGEIVAGLVAEVSDDKSLPKERRKELQILHAPSLSTGAKLIKLGDKISNVWDVANAPPADWSKERRRDYFDWSRKVVAGCRGVNRELEAEFDRVVARAEAKLDGEA